MSASMIKKPEYNGVDYSWIWMDREFIEWFAGVMSGTVNPYDTPAIRAITAKDHEQAFTKYIEDVGGYLMDIAKCRNDKDIEIAGTPEQVDDYKHYLSAKLEGCEEYDAVYLT